MGAVGFDIGDIIDDIDHTGEQAKDDKASQGAQHWPQVIQAKLAVEDQRSKDDHILHPLQRAHGLDQGDQRVNRSCVGTWPNDSIKISLQANMIESGYAQKTTGSLLVERGLAESRALAQRLVMAGQVRVNGRDGAQACRQRIRDG